jgi:molecular chaperone GrpE
MVEGDNKKPAEDLESLNGAETTEAPLPVEAGVIEETSVDLAALQKEVEELRDKSAEYLDGWQRALAEFANYKKRIEREREQMHQNAAGNIIRRYLDIVDDLDRALKKRPTEGEGAAWAAGIELIYRKLISILEAEGVKLMQVSGQPFDPSQHEAITQEESPDHASGEIIEVVQNGYLLGERVLRPARVRVAK